MRSGFLLPLGLAALLVAGGCGYRLAGRAGPAGPGIQGGLALGPVEDNGDQPLFGALLGQALARETVNRGDTSLKRPDQARVRLSVRVDSVVQTGVAFTVGDIVREYQLTGQVTATLTHADGTVLWRGRQILADRNFPAGATVQATEAAKDQALELLARDLAREVLRRATLAAESAK